MLEIQPADKESDDADESEHSDKDDEMANTGDQDIDADAEIAGSTEHAQDSNSMADPMEQGVSEDDAVDQEKTAPQIFQLTISLRDDWLHRGDALQDMDLQTYAEFIQREAKPIRGAEMKKILARPIFAFDAHYKLASGFMQVFRPSQ